jgi:ABC-type lipopolysaccharide export system ATPase subunit
VHQLLYWDIYIKEKKDKHVIVGGTLAGSYMAGLLGGQRKMLLFELIFQRTVTQKNLLIILDEPFSGVMDDFVPFILERLNKMREEHNIILVTNDHVQTLKKMADNAVIVSAIDRSKVQINEKEGIDRDLAIMAMSIGDDYKYNTTNKDLKFFINVEFSKNLEYSKLLPILS